MKNNPVLLLTILSVLTGVAAALQLLTTDHTVPGICAAIASGIIAAVGYFARNAVTPLADPKDNDGNRLTPERPPGYTVLPYEDPAPPQV